MTFSISHQISHITTTAAASPTSPHLIIFASFLSFLFLSVYLSQAKPHSFSLYSSNIHHLPTIFSLDSSHTFLQNNLVVCQLNFLFLDFHSLPLKSFSFFFSRIHLECSLVFNDMIYSSSRKEAQLQLSHRPTLQEALSLSHWHFLRKRILHISQRSRAIYLTKNTSYLLPFFIPIYLKAITRSNDNSQLQSRCRCRFPFF